MNGFFDIAQVAITTIGTIVVAWITTKTRMENRNQHSDVERVLQVVIDKIETMEAGWEKRAWAIMDGLDIPMFETDDHGNCVFVSRRWTDVTGVDYRAAMGDGWLQAVHQGDRYRVVAAWREAVDGAVQFGPMLFRYGIDDHEYLVEARPFRASDNKVHYIGAAYQIDTPDREAGVA